MTTLIVIYRQGISQPQQPKNIIPRISVTFKINNMARMATTVWFGGNTKMATSRASAKAG